CGTLWEEGKLAPRFVGPFAIIEKVGLVAYQLNLPKELNGVHDTFHVSNLKKCLSYPTLQVSLDEIRVDAMLNFVEEPMEILEREFKKLKRSRIAIVKVRWNLKRGPEFTWEREDQMKLKCGMSFEVATLRAMVHAGDKTSEDARSRHAQQLGDGVYKCHAKKERGNLDKKRSRIMVKDIDRQLMERRLMRSLEKFIGGREYGEDLRLLQRTI
ncbi:hypothetical protein Tco_0918046, partial [Tanacetum coccineum]